MHDKREPNEIGWRAAIGTSTATGDTAWCGTTWGVIYGVVPAITVVIRIAGILDAIAINVIVEMVSSAITINVELYRAVIGFAIAINVHLVRIVVVAAITINVEFVWRII